jgi:hypothetical protein
VLLNLLIALMNSTYTRLREESKAWWYWSFADLILRIETTNIGSSMSSRHHWRGRTIFVDGEGEGEGETISYAIVENTKDGYTFADGPKQPCVVLPLVALSQGDVGREITVHRGSESDEIIVHELDDCPEARSRKSTSPARTAGSGTAVPAGSASAAGTAGASAVSEARPGARGTMMPATRQVIWKRGVPPLSSETRARVVDVRLCGGRSEVELQPVQPPSTGGADIGAPVVAINPMLRQPQCWHAHQAEHTWWLRLELLNYERDKNVERERAMREREERIDRMEQVTRTVSRWQWRWVPADPPRSPPLCPDCADDAPAERGPTSRRSVGRRV